MERSVEEYSLDEPIDDVHRHDVTADARSDRATVKPERFQGAGVQGICVNPLREEPEAAVIGAVTRFGVVGLVACALGAALVRLVRRLMR